MRAFPAALERLTEQFARLPGIGMETMHHAHADDVALLFELAVESRDAAAGEDFTATAPTALSVRGYVEIASGWFGQEASIEPITWHEYRASTSEHHARESWGHLHCSQVFSIEKAKSALGYAPANEPEQAIPESVAWPIENGDLEVDKPLEA